jgi:hypothetical protein
LGKVSVRPLCGKNHTLSREDFCEDFSAAKKTGGRLRGRREPNPIQKNASPKAERIPADLRGDFFAFNTVAKAAGHTESLLSCSVFYCLHCHGFSRGNATVERRLFLPKNWRCSRRIRICVNFIRMMSKNWSHFLRRHSR